MIACAYLVFKLARPGGLALRRKLFKTILLAAAFLFWAANQLWPNLPQASLFNDIAIGLFVLDVFFVIAGWPAGSSGSFLDDCCGCGARRCSCVPGTCGCGCCDHYVRAADEVLESVEHKK